MQTMQRGFYEANSQLYSEYYGANPANGYLYANPSQYYYDQTSATTGDAAAPTPTACSYAAAGNPLATIPQGSGHTTIIPDHHDHERRGSGAEILYTSTDEQDGGYHSPASSVENRESVAPASKSPTDVSSKEIYPWMTESRQNKNQKTVHCGKLELET